MSVTRPSVRYVVLAGVCAMWLAGSTQAAAHVAVVVKGPTDRLVSEGTLSASNANGPVGFTNLNLADGTLAGAAYTYNPNLGWVGGGSEVYVFTEPSSGWSSETAAARLTASNGVELDFVAVAGDDVFVGAPDLDRQGPGLVYVFAKPPGGWSGEVHESAQLIASDATGPYYDGPWVAASGQTVVVSRSCAVYVFTEPVGGWSGVIHESAKLTASDGVCVGGPAGGAAIAGHTVVASAPDAAYVFEEPPSGWSGSLHETARLTATGARVGLGGPVGTSGSVVVADGRRASHDTLYLFTAPRGGWAGIVHQSAERNVPVPWSDLGPMLAMSGRSVGAVVDKSSPSTHECPCSGTVYAFSRPAGRWTGVLPVTPAGGGGGTGWPEEITLSGTTLAVPGDNSIDVSAIITPPTVSHVSLTGLATGHPGLRFTINAGAGAPPITNLTLQPPSGLSFTHNTRRLAQGITVPGATNRRVVNGSLAASFAPSAGPLPITITDTALRETRGLTRRIDRTLSYNRTHRKKHKIALNMVLLVGDSTHGVTRVTLDGTIT